MRPPHAAAFSQTPHDTEHRPWLAAIPIAATVLFYTLPASTMEQTLFQMWPQLCAYLCLGFWVHANTAPIDRLGLAAQNVAPGLRHGCLIGLALGILNTTVILWLVPALGWDISFLRQTPHAQLPPLVMIPWFIVAIAVFVEVNFRGFLLGRLLTLFAPCTPPSAALSAEVALWRPFAAVVASALVFAHDPFMVMTFQHLHWIALWDGIIWAWSWLRTGNLYVAITAHAVEVIVLYLSLRHALM